MVSLKKTVLFCLLASFVWAQQNTISKRDTLTKNDDYIELSSLDFTEGETDFNTVTGAFQNQYDVFSRSVRFRWGQLWMRPKGYDTSDHLIMIDGVEMNTFSSGRPSWNQWGGLNDSFRKATFSNGSGAVAWHAGYVGQTTHFTTNPFAQKLGSKISLMTANQQYRARAMVSHTQRISEKTQVHFTSSYRGGNGAIKGTPYEAYSGLFSIGYQLDERQLLYLTAMTVSNKRGTSAPMTEEVFELKGKDYNPYWGVQNGSVRNAREKKITHHNFSLVHHFQINEKISLHTTVNYQFGKEQRGQIGTHNAPSPSPIYYQYLPSYALSNNRGSVLNAYLNREKLKENGQIHWQELYKINTENNYAHYHLYDDTLAHQQYYLTQKFSYDAGVFFIDASLHLRHQNSLHYAQLTDLLGGRHLENTDPYQTGLAQYYDLQNKTSLLKKGDDFKYRYGLEKTSGRGFLRAGFRRRKWETDLALGLGGTVYRREGFYKNGRYPRGFGKGARHIFKALTLKSATLWKISPLHLVFFRGSYFWRPPQTAQVFLDARYHNGIAGEDSFRQTLAEIGYNYRGGRLKASVNFYVGMEWNLHKTRSFYTTDFSRFGTGFFTRTISGLSQKRYGLEIGLEFLLDDNWSVDFATSLGQFFYANHPHLSIFDTAKNSIQNLGKVYIKGDFIEGTPQQAVGFGFRYKHPDYWFLGGDMNFLDGRFIAPNFIARSPHFLSGADGHPTLDEATGKPVKNTDWYNLTAQKKLPSVFVVNVNGGKSWRISDFYVKCFFSVQNILGSTFKTGGFEQTHLGNYTALKKDKNNKTPVFAPKYWWNKGTVYFLIFSLQF